MVEITCPVRIDISAGWSDADPFREDFGGCILNGAINLRICVSLDKGKLVSSLKDVPKNSGLGTSAALRTSYLVVSNLKLLRDKFDLIRKVWVFENKVLCQRAGLQDQASAVFGGVNLWKFGKGDGEEVKISRVSVNKKKAQHLENRLVLIYTGEHLSSDIHSLVFKNYKKNIPFINRMKEIAIEMYDRINNEKEVSELIDESWKLQKKLHSSIETFKMRVLQSKLKGKYSACRVSGAGGGGCMIFYTSDKRRLVREVQKLEKKIRVRIIPFSFDFNGIKVIE